MKGNEYKYEKSNQHTNVYGYGYKPYGDNAVICRRFYEQFNVNGYSG